MRIQKATLVLNNPGKANDSLLKGTDSKAFLIVTLLYLVALLTTPLEFPQKIIWFAAYPILMAPMCGITYSSVFLKSLYVLPFIIFIGIFNPLYDRNVAFEAGTLKITMGWITFFSIVLRGLLAMQALIILVKVTGFPQICECLQKLGMPKVLTTQLMMLYRYIGVLMEEASNMHRAATARGYGKKSFPIKFWTNFVGMLLLRSYEKAKNIHRAMLARGFRGSMEITGGNSWTYKDTLFVGIWGIVFLGLRFFNLSEVFF